MNTPRQIWETPELLEYVTGEDDAMLEAECAPIGACWKSDCCGATSADVLVAKAMIGLAGELLNGGGGAHEPRERARRG
ncbi:MAG TPA: hypothetical protein VN915_06850 [Elusimicrobiota bacterium]|nr:hypothetical protein [Elusimicrobiota bacterium]